MKAVSIFFTHFDSQISAAYIRKRFNFESGLDSVKYGICDSKIFRKIVEIFSKN